MEEGMWAAAAPVVRRGGAVSGSAELSSSVGLPLAASQSAAGCHGLPLMSGSGSYGWQSCQSPEPIAK